MCVFVIESYLSTEVAQQILDPSDYPNPYLKLLKVKPCLTALPSDHLWTIRQVAALCVFAVAFVLQWFNVVTRCCIGYSSR